MVEESETCSRGVEDTVEQDLLGMAARVLQKLLELEQEMETCVENRTCIERHFWEERNLGGAADFNKKLDEVHH